MPSSGYTETSEKSIMTVNVIGYIESDGPLCTIPASLTKQTHYTYIINTLIIIMLKISLTTCVRINSIYRTTAAIKSFKAHRELMQYFCTL